MYKRQVLGGMIWLKMENINVGTAIDLSGLGLDTIEAVSYTHLDVYKRQGWAFTVRAVATAFAENSLAELESYEKTLELVFPLAVEEMCIRDRIEQRIYERQALLCRYRYLLARARELGLHTVLTKYQPAGQV